uniref:Autophagy-related protein 2 homolog A-like n=1 Tax=Sinocyclocheilus anshuiensis TaxID=1608454 RepID=A0A671SK87_9TELE
MSRWLFPWSGSIKKRACRYLLQHYLGHFLEERLSLDQLSLDLYNGSGVITEINLDVWAVNELLDSLGAPLEIVEGFVNSIAVTIPWAALVTEHCTLEVTGLQITCRPKYRTSEFYGNWDSQGWSSCMTSSMQLAQECLKDPPEASEEPPAPLEGLEMFAQTIETVLRRIKVTFLDTIVRVEHHSLDAETGVALEMLDYCDEAVRDSSQTVPVDIHQPPAFLHKILQLNSVKLLYETLGGSQPPEPLLIGQCSGFIETMVKIKQNEMLPGPKVLSSGMTVLFLSLLSDGGGGGGGVSGGGVSRPLGSDDLRLIEEDLSKQLNSEMHDRDLELEAEPYVTSMENGAFSCNPSSVFVFFPRIERSSRSSQSEPLKPDSLLRLSLGGVTLTLLEQDPPPGPDGLSSLAEVSQLFFRELGFFKDSMFSERDFHNLRGNFAKACPHSHIRVTGAAVQLACEMRSAGRHTRATTSDLSFSRLELLECLWDSGGPQYTESRLQRSLNSPDRKQQHNTPTSAKMVYFLTLHSDIVCNVWFNPLSFSLQSHLLELHSSLLLQSPYAVLKVRFPIPDLRPLGLRRPLSQCAVRNEILSLQISNLELKSQQGPDVQQDGPCSPGAKLTKLLEACFTDMHGEASIYFFQLSYTLFFLSKQLIQIQIRVNEGAGSDSTGVCEGVNRDLGLGSMSLENPCELREKNSSPFSSNRTMFETEEMVIPADPEEMDEFQTQCICQCQYVFDITFPVAYILLPSKEAFLSIYNRINNDLLMWEPPPPPPFPPPAPPSSFQSSRSPSHQYRPEKDEFYLCKSAFRLGQSCSFVSYVESRHQCVTQHQNNPNLNFLTVESRRVELYHKAEVPDSPIPVKLEMPRFTSPGHLDPTIYPTEVGVSSVGGRETDVQMLSTAIKITLDLERNVKEFLVALRLHGATLRHHMALTNHSWHEQIVDFLDVIDDDILGYTPPAVITVLHTHLATCAVDYRPLYLPLRVLFTAESFSLSSNIIVDTATFHLRFILDDSALYLSDKCESDTVDLRRDYVCVLDIDLLELAITTWKGTDSSKLTQPLFELRCSNNVVHVHTCADSCAALVNMLQYLVSQGDLHPPPRHTSPTEIAGQKLLLSESPASLPPCPPAETAEINQCDLTDALIDTERILQEDTQDSGSPSIRRASPVSVYLFPGEAPKHRPSVLEGEESDIDGLVSTAMEAHADMMSEEGSEGSTDNDDFCILEAPGMGIPPRDGEPVVTVLSQDPIKVRDGYYSRPRGSSDLLRAPARFPVPQNRVVLREVSVVWHLYGGKDFGGKPTAPGARGSPSRSAGPSRPQNSWRWVGGSGRQHTLLMEIQLTKVSFQHETYPVVAPPAAGPDAEGPGLGEQPISRQVFIVQELEVRDRLASSQINKFLYLYTSESMPRRAHSNMLTVKALQVMPESGLGGPECCLRVSLLPLRLNIDQVLIMREPFFSTEQIMFHIRLRKSRSSSSAGSSSSSEQPIYFREFRFTSEVPIWLDYHGKHVVIEQGTFAGILIGLAQLNCSELKLKRLCCRHGLLGVDKVIQYAVNEWLTDIRKNQLPGILGGVGPMHSVVQLFHGVRDLFWMPIEQYRKDGRIIRGLQRGAASFGTSTASAALELSNRLVQAIQATAETVYDILSPTPPLTRYITEGRPTPRPRRTPQPADLREGVAKAYDTVREGVIDTAQTLCDVASRGHEQKGLPGAVGGVLRQIPPTVVRPLIVASEATSNLLGGMRNQIKPDARKEDFLKWRTEDGQE